MATLKDLRTRIKSVTQTQKITSAMKMVAASKLRRAQEAAESARPYAQRMERMVGSLAELLRDRDDAPVLLRGSGADNTHLIIVATSDRGLCGGFNSSITRAVRLRIRELTGDGKTVKLYCIGRKGREQLSREFGSLIVGGADEIGKRGPSYGEAETIGIFIGNLFAEGEFDVCTIVYNHFKSVMTQIVTFQQVIPFAEPASEGGAEEDAEAVDHGGAIYEFEPEEADILEELLPYNLSIQVFRALLENAASEQGSRMTAMDSATRNAGDMIDALTLKFNRTRQAKITGELIEIISGAEAI
jgi:F-type H+-transporting ATPase subunit gamma